MATSQPASAHGSAIEEKMSVQQAVRRARSHRAGGARLRSQSRSRRHLPAEEPQPIFRKAPRVFGPMPGIGKFTSVPARAADLERRPPSGRRAGGSSGPSMPGAFTGDDSAASRGSPPVESSVSEPLGAPWACRLGQSRERHQRPSGGAFPAGPGASPFGASLVSGRVQVPDTSSAYHGSEVGARHALCEVPLGQRG